MKLPKAEDLTQKQVLALVIAGTVASVAVWPLTLTVFLGVCAWDKLKR